MYSVDPGEQYGRSIIYGSTQTETYEPLYARMQEGETITKWQFSNAEREAIAAGKPLVLRILTFGGSLQPVALWIEDDNNGI